MTRRLPRKPACGLRMVRMISEASRFGFALQRLPGACHVLLDRGTGFTNLLLGALTGLGYGGSAGFLSRLATKLPVP